MCWRLLGRKVGGDIINNKAIGTKLVRTEKAWFLSSQVESLIENEYKCFSTWMIISSCSLKHRHIGDWLVSGGVRMNLTLHSSIFKDSICWASNTSIRMESRSDWPSALVAMTLDTLAACRIEEGTWHPERIAKTKGECWCLTACPCKAAKHCQSLMRNFLNLANWSPALVDGAGSACCVALSF